MRDEAKLPPQDRLAEQYVLGSMLRDNSCIADVLEIVEARAFYFDAHQKIFRAMIDCHSRGPVDAAILADRLLASKWLDDAGGAVYLFSLWEISPTSANAAYYAKIVSDKFMLREVIHCCVTSLRDAYDQSLPGIELVERLQAESFRMGSMTKRTTTVSLNDAIMDAMVEMDRQSKGDKMGIPFGLADLDNATGGLHAGEFAILAARPSVGKTSLAANIAEDAGRRGIGSLFFSLEQSRLELARRMIGGAADVNSHSIRQGRLARDQTERIMVAANDLRPLPIWINDNPYQRLPSILSVTRRVCSKESIGLIVIDFLQLIDVEKRGNRNEQIGEISRGLKLLAREVSLPVLCLCQMSRSVEQSDRKPRLSDLRDSGEIEQTADTVIFLHRAGARDPQSKIDVVDAIIGKQRNGPTCEVQLAFRKSRMRFENYLPEIHT